MFVKKGAELLPYPPHKQQGDDHHGEHVQDYKLPSRLHLSIEILIISFADFDFELPVSFSGV